MTPRFPEFLGRTNRRLMSVGVVFLSWSFSSDDVFDALVFGLHVETAGVDSRRVLEEVKEMKEMKVMKMEKMKVKVVKMKGMKMKEMKEMKVEEMKL